MYSMKRPGATLTQRSDCVIHIEWNGTESLMLDHLVYHLEYKVHQQFVGLERLEHHLVQK